jgi:ABC-2 type transport system permease protein
LKEECIMSNAVLSIKAKLSRTGERIRHPFRVIVGKEMADHIRSWRFVILIAIIALTSIGSLYTALANFSQAVKPNDPEGTFFFLKLFTITDGTMPSFTVFISFLGPLLGIALGFDAINSEHNRGTLGRMLSQPIHRDYIINAKFTAALAVISVMLTALGLMVMGAGLFFIGIPPTAGEFMRIVFFILLSILYVAFWLNLSILFSVLFRQPATAALSAIAVWLFFSVFYPLIVNLITKSLAPSEMAAPQTIIAFEQFRLALLRVMPNQLFSEATTTLLMPSVRSLGPLPMDQMIGALPGPLPLGQSLLMVWPQVTGLAAGTIISFVISYVLFMRREIRSR